MRAPVPAKLGENCACGMFLDSSALDKYYPGYCLNQVVASILLLSGPSDPLCKDGSEATSALLLLSSGHTFDTPDTSDIFVPEATVV